MNLTALQTEALGSVSFLRPYLPQLACLALGALVFGSILGLLQDIEYADYDESNAVVAWVKNYCSGPSTSAIAPVSRFRKVVNLPLFDHGPVSDSIKSEAVIQGAVFDCRFIATVASFTASEAGKEAICSSIKAAKDGSYRVYFPGVKQSIAVSKLTGKSSVCKNA